MTEAPLVTLCICTRDRAASLARTLDSIVIAAHPEGRSIEAAWELVVVDNGSSDHTQETVAGYADRLPIRSIIHHVAGLSNARNAGIDTARGRFILWTDDDVLVDHHWLRSYITAFEASPEIGLFGGRAVPHYEEPSTPWMAENEASLSSLLAIRDTPEWTEIAPGRMPFGLNYAVRRDIQMRHRYDPNLGVAPGRRTGGEETTMLKAALTDQAKSRWVWDATVYHLIPVHRQSVDYVFEYYVAQGSLYPKCQPQSDSPAARLHALRRAGSEALRNRWRAFLRYRMGRNDWVGSYADYARWVGTMRTLRTTLGRSA